MFVSLNSPHYDVEREKNRNQLSTKSKGIKETKSIHKYVYQIQTHTHTQKGGNSNNQCAMEQNRIESL